MEENNSPENNDDGKAMRKSGMAYAAGLTIFFAVASFMAIGWLLDRWLGTTWIMIAGILVGAAIGLYEFVRIVSKIK